MVLLVDVSGSQNFGTRQLPKRSVAAELAALIAFSAIANNDRVGLMAFTDSVERYVPPAKGAKHVLRLLRDILYFKPIGRGTSIAAGLDYLNQVQRKRSIVFLISDFADDLFEKALRLAGRRHDLIAVRITDPIELEMPEVGLVHLADAETGNVMLVDTPRPAFRVGYASRRSARRLNLEKTMRGANIDLIDVNTDGGHFDSLLGFFRMRQGRRRRG